MDERQVQSSDSFNSKKLSGTIHRCSLSLLGMDATNDYEEPLISVFREDFSLSGLCRSEDRQQSIGNCIEDILQRDNFYVDENVGPVIWDFAGQAVYRDMHPVFISPEAVYLLVSDLSEDLFSIEDRGSTSQATSMERQAESNFDYLMRWMNHFHSLRLADTAKTPVILVGTHADKVGDPQKPLNRRRALLSNIISDDFFVDNTCSGQIQEDVNVVKLRQKIMSLASRSNIPLHWLQVEKVLQCLASERYKYLTLDEYKAVVKRVCHSEVDEDSDDLLHFLCARGAVLLSKELDGLVFLDPQWLIRLICQIVSFVSGLKEPISGSKTLTNCGILSEVSVNFVCQELKLSVRSLLYIARKVGLLCNFRVTGENAVFLVPSVLLKHSPGKETKELIGTDTVAPVYITFNSGYVPLGLFSRFVVKFCQWASQMHSASPPKLFANKAQFIIGRKKTFCLTFAVFKSVIMIHVLPEGKSTKSEVAFICSVVYRLVVHSFN